MENDKPNSIEQHKNKPSELGSTTSNKIERLLQNGAHIAQISLVLLAVLAYVYTVRPVYQRDRLAEQVAQSELLLTDLDEQLQISALRNEEYVNAATKVQETLNSMQMELEKQVIALEHVKQERDSIERQIQFMDFKYYLPDGSPADTAEEVVKVKEEIAQAKYRQSRSSFFANMRWRRTFLELERTINNDYSAPFDIFLFDIPVTSPDFPFTKEELDLWKQHGRHYPTIAAIEIVKKNAVSLENAELIAEKTNHITESDVADWKQLAIESIYDKERDWLPLLDPVEYVSQVQLEFSKITTERDQKLANLKPGLLIHEAARYKIKASTVKNRLEVTLKANKMAFDFRTDIGNEINYLLNFDELIFSTH